MVKPRRSWLVTPADQRRALASSAALIASVRVIDLEDGARPDRLDEARASLSDAIAAIAPHQEVWVRIHAPTVSETAASADLEAATVAGLAGIVIAKAAEPDDVQMVAEWLDAGEGTGAERGAIQIGLMVETAFALEFLPRLAGLPRVRRLFLGLEDLRAGIHIGAASATAMYSRARVVAVSAAYGLAPPIYSPWMHLADVDGLHRTARAVHDDGFEGMLCVHPSQVEVVESAFAPSRSDIEWARRITNSEPETGAAAWLCDDQVVDAPVLARAKSILRDIG